MDFTGERFVPGTRGNIEIEHLHRYIQAARLVAGKRVLDIACGEGYGTEILSRIAASVVGVDISAQAVAHASSTYSSRNISFLVGSCSNIPLADRSVDVAVSFETIEHHAEHEEMLLEIRRVLQPDGVLVISTPDKYNHSIKTGRVNEYHVRELFEHEFKDLISRHFKNCRFLAQKTIFGSVIAPAEDSARTVGSWKAKEGWHEGRGLTGPIYWIAIASNGAVPACETAILEQHIDESEVVMGWKSLVEQRNAQITKLKRRLKKAALDREQTSALLKGEEAERKCLQRRRR